MKDQPFPHLVIRASAGSGKTHRLTNRYLALLAAGVLPESILATTFTRKAAGEILERVLQRLAHAASDAATAKTLAGQIGQNACGPSQCTRLLRTLLHNLHRVRIGTLDSFYIALAGSFSLELAMPAGWSICEGTDDAELRREALERLLEREPEDIARLFPLLSKGEMKRSVQSELRDVIDRHHEIFLGSTPPAWDCLRVPERVAAARCEAALEQLKQCSFADKRWAKAHEKDIDNAQREDWLAFIGVGLAAKVAAGDPSYHKKPIPPQALKPYETLVQHARAEVLCRLAEQTRATFDLLRRFDHELAQLKQATGRLRFGEVTQALVQGLTRNALVADGLAFRLDGAVEHLLLDEFQDTALAQWQVLQPIAKGITQWRVTGASEDSNPGHPDRSFFCVGDVKQAIYGWRGGMAAIMDTLRLHLGTLREAGLAESRRSAQPIIDVVNQVFGGLAQLDLGDKAQDGLANWRERFDEHSTARKDISGYVCLHAGPERQEDQTVNEQRALHYQYVAERVAALVRLAPGRSVGVLCRTNPAVARTIFELRRRNVEASEEGGNALSDSPAVELLLSLLALADHPGNSVAWFHVRNSPLRDHIQAFADAETLSQQLRRDLLAEGYGKFTQDLATRLAPACDRRDLSRLQQLVEMAYGYQARSTLRADDFAAYVRQQRVPDPSSAHVRVMTIHGAKGLQFDAVVLPELDVNLAGRPPSFVVGRDPKTLEMNFVCRYADESVQGLLGEKERQAFEQDRMQRIEESLSLLYVAMTRAVHAMYLVIPGPHKGKHAGKATWNNLLVQSLAANEAPVEKGTLWQHGDAKWFQSVVGHRPSAVGQATDGRQPIADSRQPIVFQSAQSERRRGMELVAPSRQEGGARVALDKLFHPSPGTGTAAGTLYHAWFESITWLDDGLPTEATLRATAARLRVNLPPDLWDRVNQHLATFLSWLGNPAVNSVLKRSAYSSPQQAGFPQTLKSFWKPSFEPQKVEQERPFLVRDSGQFWNGNLDRVVWLGEGKGEGARTVAADVIDYKTDAIPPGDAKALAERVEHYRPQLAAYRRVVARLGKLPEERVSARLVFTIAGQVVDIV